MNESLTLAKYIVNIDYDDIPSNVADTTKRSFLEGLGVMIAASGLGEGCQQFIDLAVEGGGKEESTIIGSDTKVPSYMAAYANGSMAHALDFENTHMVHPNAAAIPAALSLAESLGNVSGKELIAAITLGSEMVCRLSLARSMGSPASRQGADSPGVSAWYIPSIYGTIGATAAASKVLGLSPEQVVDAFSLSMCQSTCSGELIFSPRSYVRAIRDAFAAKAGVLSAIMAKKGIIGFEQPIEGKAGFYTMYAGGNYDPGILTKDLGKVFECLNVSFKPWPACRGTHPYIAAALQIVDEYDIKPGDIEAIKFILNSPNTMLCEPLESKRKPTTAIDAKFSIPFCIATAVVHKKVDLSHFTAQALLDNEVLEVAQKITYEVGSAIPQQGYEVQPDLVHIKTGRELISSKAIEFMYGHPKNPMSQEALVAKFMDCASYSVKPISKDNLDKVVQLILHLEDVSNISEIVECL
ncbi:MmgE/PrpD family protein [Chloroflexota bacterium]